MSLQKNLVIMAKAPRIGRVKTRLAYGVGRIAAWSFYRRTLAEVSRRLANDPRWQTRLAVSPGPSVCQSRIWPVNCMRMAQGEGDLGQRMGRVMAGMPPGPVVIVGADIPDIYPFHIAAAFDAIGRNDAVFGPADDGGYWLVGLKRRPVIPEIFSDVRWSTQHALRDTCANLPASASVSYLETLSDVDDAADLVRQARRTRVHSARCLVPAFDGSGRD